MCVPWTALLLRVRWYPALLLCRPCLSARHCICMPCVLCLLSWPLCVLRPLCMLIRLCVLSPILCVLWCVVIVCGPGACLTVCVVICVCVIVCGGISATDTT